jgi:hypothetical protein
MKYITIGIRKPRPKSSNWTPEARARQSAIVKKRWSEHRETMLAGCRKSPWRQSNQVFFKK